MAGDATSAASRTTSATMKGKTRRQLICRVDAVQIRVDLPAGAHLNGDAPAPARPRDPMDVAPALRHSRARRGSRLR